MDDKARREATEEVFRWLSRWQVVDLAVCVLVNLLWLAAMIYALAHL